MRMLTVLTSLLLLLLPVLVLGCGGDGTGPDKKQVATVAVYPPSSIVEVGTTIQLSAQARNAKGDLLDPLITWTSSASSVATCSGSGLVTGISEGTATITARADGVSGTGSVLVVDLSVPNSPSNLSSSPISNVSIRVTWSDNSENEDEFRIDRQQVLQVEAGEHAGPAKVFGEVRVVGPGVTQFLDTGLQSGTLYRYRVRACNENGCSDPSANQTESATFPLLVIETQQLPDGYVGKVYEQTLVATGGDGDPVWSIHSGSLPAGLALSTSGVISGTPTTEQVASPVFQVEGGGQIVLKGFGLTIDRIPRGRILFSSDRTGNREIFVINADGTGLTNLTNSPGDDEYPEWSPDGSKIAFGSNRDGNDEIYVMNADGTQQARITNHPDHDAVPSWTPDGNAVVFQSKRQGGKADLYVSDLAGKIINRLTNHPASDINAVYSPDGTRIAFDSDRTGLYDVFTMNPDGSGLINLTAHPANDAHPDWSPDGSKIVFKSDRDGPVGIEELYVLDVSSGGVTRLTYTGAREVGPVWSADGEYIAFHSDLTGDWEIYIMRKDGSELTRLTSDGGTDFGASWGW